MLISWDTEHEPGDDYVKLKPLTCVSYAQEDGKFGLLHARDPKAKEFIALVLTHHTSVGANIAHDMAEVCLEWPDLIPLVWRAYEEGRVRCLIQCEVLIGVARGLHLPTIAKNLEALALQYKYGQLDKDEDNRMGYGPLRDVPLDQWTERQRRYAIEDAKAGLAVALTQPALTYWQSVAREDFLCVLMGAWGFRTHLGRVSRLRTYCKGELDKAIAVLTKGTELRKLNKSKKLAVPDAYGLRELLAAPILRPNPKQKTGYSETERVTLARMAATGATRRTKRPDGTEGDNLSCDAVALEESGDPMLRALASYNSFQKRFGVCDILARGELHCWFKPMQENNQTSCSSPYNAQNPPTDGGERECIIPRPGNCFIDADVNLFHMHAFAQVCLETVGRSDMADVLNDFAQGRGQKPHVITGAALAGVPIEKFQAKGEHSHIYRLAKEYNFALLADAGFKRVAQSCSKKGIKLDEREFWAAKSAWKQRYPESFMYFDYIQSLGDGATITELFTGRVRGGCSYTDAANGYFSGLANTAIKAAWWRVARECYDPSQGSILFGSRPVDIIHDQLLVETPDDAGAHDRAMRVKAIMEEEIAKFLPDVPATTDPCLASCFSKQAEAVFDKNGRHQVWSPSEDRKAA